jgi:hypothetical protein
MGKRCKKLSIDISTSIAGVPMHSPLGLASTSPGNWHYPKGPAIIFQMDSTTLVYSKQMATVDEYGNIIIEEKL